MSEEGRERAREKGRESEGGRERERVREEGREGESERGREIERKRVSE